MSNYPDRIPYDSWANSQLSIAAHYGGCTLNGDSYRLDYDNCKTKIGEDGEIKYFPDLVKVKSKKKPKKKLSNKYSDDQRDFWTKLYADKPEIRKKLLEGNDE